MDDPNVWFSGNSSSLIHKIPAYISSMSDEA